MKTYLRILGFAKPLGNYVPQYIIFTLLSIIFGILNYSLIKPLFDVIFEKVDREKIEAYREKPDFDFSFEQMTNLLDNAIHLFYYHFLQFIEEYGKLGSLGYICMIIVISVLLSNLFKYLSAVILA